MLNRTLAPETPAPTWRGLPTVTDHRLPNGVRVVGVPFGPEPVAEVRLLFRAGNAYCSKPGVPKLLAALLPEGTAHRGSAALAAALERCGAQLEVHAGAETIRVSLVGLSQHLEEAIKLLAEVVLEPGFPPQEFELLQRRTLSGLQVQAEQTRYHAQRAFVHRLFGPSHPLGHHLGPEELAKVHLADLRALHRDRIHAGTLAVVVAGQYPDRILKALELHFGRPDQRLPVEEAAWPAPTPAPPGRWEVPMPGKQQAALRLGLLLPPRTHPDFHALHFGVLLLGGYFGARLMQNIREDKGYTYGISAAYSARQAVGYLSIGTDVALEYVDATLNEVAVEINRLQQDAIPAEEFETARNYRLGQLLARHETPFQLADRAEYALLNGLPLDHDRTTFEAIQALSPAVVHTAIQTQLRATEFRTVVAGTPEAA